MLDAEYIYRDSQIRETSTWVDSGTVRIHLLSVLYVLEKRVGTVLFVDFVMEADGVDSKVTLRSFSQMSAEVKISWTAVLVIAFVFAARHLLSHL